MKKTFNTFSDLTPFQALDFDMVQHMAYDVNAIHHFLQSSLQTTDHIEISKLFPLVESIVSLIKTHIHETENIENSKDCVADN